MRIGRHLKYALENWKLTEEDSLPNIEHFFEFCGDCVQLKNMYYYLRFLQRTLNAYSKLTHHLISFNEFLDYKYLKEKTPTEE